MSATVTEQAKPSASEEPAKEAPKSAESSEKKAAPKGKREGGKAKSGGSRFRRPNRQQSSQTQLQDALRMLRGWPTPCKKHLDALNEFFERTLKEQAVALDELDKRAELVRAFETDADAKLQRLHLVGPARTGFALRTNESSVLVELVDENEGERKGVKRERGGDKKSENEKDDAEPASDADKEAKVKRTRKTDAAARRRSAFERIVDAATRRGCELVERDDKHVLVRERSGATYCFRFAPDATHARMAIQNATLLRHYAALDSRCRSVGILLSVLASALHLDSLDDAPRRATPSNVRDQLATLTVYFFQKVKGTLPCLHELVSLATAPPSEQPPTKDETAKDDKAAENESEQKPEDNAEGESGAAGGDKDKRKGGKERGKRSGTRETRRRVIPSVTEWQNVGDLFAAWKAQHQSAADKTPEASESVAQLFLELLSFLALDFDPLATVVSLSSSRAVMRRVDSRAWSSLESAGYLFIEDASRRTFNVCSALRSAEAWRALNHRLVAAYRYFATPLVRRGTDEKVTRLFDFVKVDTVLESRTDNTAASESKASNNASEKEDVRKDAAQDAKKDAADEAKPDEAAKDEPAATQENGGSTQKPRRERERDRERTRRTVVRRTIVDSDEAGWYAAKLIDTLNEETVTLVYEWSAETIVAHFPVAALRLDAKSVLSTSSSAGSAPVTAPAATAAPSAATGSSAAATTAATGTGASAPERETARRGCEVCHREHPETDAECPLVKRCALERASLRKVSRQYAWFVSELMFTLCERCEPTDHEIELKQSVIDDVFDILARTVHPNTRVDVFGSCANGFEFRGSDMDLCVTFGEIRETPTRVWQVERLRKFSDILRNAPSGPFRVVKLIETARVPIIKFLHVPTRVRGDVCLYNLLALENTALMRTYSKIDSRVSVLGSMLKSLVKQMRINDASQRTLSSYAYLNMLVYFLQHCDPPVLPVLQELYDNAAAPSKKGAKQQSPAAASSPQRLIDGKNVWFQSNTDYIHSHFKVAENVKTYGELWIEFLHFYAHKFNFREHVVSIRQHKLLKKSEKNWTHGRSLCFAIEDPFDTAHNLGDVLVPSTMARILDVFRAAYQLFTDEAKFNEAFKDKKKEFRELRNYFFKLNLQPVANATAGKRAASAPARPAAENDKAAERERTSGRERRERRPRRLRGKKEKDGAAKTQANANGEPKRDGEDADDDVRIAARNDADENDAFDSAESSPKKSAS